MSLQTIEIALPSDLIEQIDAEVGPEHRSEFFAQVAREAVESATADKHATGPPVDESEEVLRPSRFRPIEVRGEPVSHTIMRDRGSL